MALALGVLGRLGIDDFLAGEGFAQRTPRTPRFGKGNAEMFICCMGIDHEWTRIFTNGEGRGNGTTKDFSLSSTVRRGETIEEIRPQPLFEHKPATEVHAAPFFPNWLSKVFCLGE